ncbi:hypothetical protein HK104_001321 [Borealophlyctis nickersoniae]|nr:hypothetical protein HK104_001321 [Borealophlyctis nickersoniae]
MATIKLGSLVIRTLAKPLANSVKQQAKNHAKFREFCINVAQTTHNWSEKLKMKLGDTKRPIRPLNDAKAVETGANMLSEGLVMSVAILTILGETYRSQRKTKREKRDLETAIDELEEDSEKFYQFMEDMRKSMAALTSEVEELKAERRRLKGDLESMGKRVEAEEAATRRGWLGGWLNWETAKRNGSERGLENGKVEHVVQTIYTSVPDDGGDKAYDVVKVEVAPAAPTAGKSWPNTR